MGRRKLAIALVAFLVTTIIGSGIPSAQALSGDENCFFRLMNSERVSRGRAKLRIANDLVTIARRHSRWMAQDGTIYHADRNSPHYRQGDDYQHELRGNWWSGGENVGMGPDCKAIHDAFMASPGHRSNILDRSYNQVGVGVAYDSNGTVYVTEDFAGRPFGGVRRIVVHTSTPRRAPVRRVPKRVAHGAEAPQTVDVLLSLLGLDAARVDPVSGQALGI